MNISSEGSSFNTTAVVNSVNRQAQTSEQAAARTKLIQAVKTVNENKALGADNELTLAVDRTTHRTIIRIINRKTQDVVQQIPAESVLRLADQVKQNLSA